MIVNIEAYDYRLQPAAHIILEILRLSVPSDNSTDSPRMEYQAAMGSEVASKSVLGEVRNPGANVRVAVEARKRERKDEATHYGQRWFPEGSRAEAALFIRDLLRAARSRVMIADPYLATLQLGQFLYVLHGSEVRATLLTTKLAFSPTPPQGKLDLVEAFKLSLQHLSGHQQLSPKVCIIPSSSLHDRFLVVDDEVWIVGSSLNSLGEKASMVVRLPNPDEVIDRLQALVAMAPDLDAYIRSHGFVDNALLEAIGKAMQGQTLILEVPEDAAPWEAWCYRCVLSSFANDGFVETPSFKEFASQWDLSPEDWRERKGRDLLKSAALHFPRDDMPGLSANLLVFSLASGDGVALGWQQLWDSAYYLREVLEFGSVDAGPKAYSDRSDASSLLLLLACMGLACFDQVIARRDASPEPPIEQMASLHGALAAAVMEVLHLDDTLNRDRWQALLHHVALRRAYWDSRYGIQHPVAVFEAQQRPTIRDYLNYFQADPGDLVTFLHACMLNKLDPPTLREDLRGASIDLRACVNTLKRLHELRDHRYPMNGRAIEAIKPLMDYGETLAMTVQAEA